MRVKNRVIRLLLILLILIVPQGAFLHATAVDVNHSDTPMGMMNVEPPVLATIVVSPESASLEINESLQFEAQLYDQIESTWVDVTSDCSWSSSNETVGTIREDGVFSAHAAGETIVIAEDEEGEGTAVVTVNQQVLAPDVTNNTPNATNDTPEVDGFKATTGPSVRARPPPERILTSITIDPQSVTLNITDVLQFSATCFDQYGNEMPEVSVAWTSSNETVGTIDSDGELTAQAAGQADVTAVYGNVSTVATVIVNAQPPDQITIAIAPESASLEVAESQRFEATCRDQYGNEMAEVAVSWLVDNETVGTIDEEGVFQALAPGTATITAGVEGFDATAVATVSVGLSPEPVLTSITIAPQPVILNISDVRQFNATCYDQHGNEMPDEMVSWSVDNETVGIIDEEGFFTARDVGETTVTGVADGVKGSAPVMVSDGQKEQILTSIVVEPASTSLAVDENQQFKATCLDQDGNQMPGITVAWTSSDESVGNVDASGFFKALDEGNATVMASADGISGFGTVTVSGPPYLIFLIIVVTLTGIPASYSVWKFVTRPPSIQPEARLPVNIEISGGVEAAHDLYEPGADVSVDVTGGIEQGGGER